MVVESVSRLIFVKSDGGVVFDEIEINFVPEQFTNVVDTISS